MTTMPFAAASVLLSALLLAGCVSSTAPVLTDSKPLLGERPRMVLYGLRDGAARDPERASFRWDGGRYVKTSGLREVAFFTIHPFEGRDLIVQSTSRRNKSDRIEYALARKLAEGAYLVVALDEEDADAATRESSCTKSSSASCQVENRDKLLALVRAVAAKEYSKGGLALLLAERSR